MDRPVMGRMILALGLPIAANELLNLRAAAFGTDYLRLRLPEAPERRSHPRGRRESVSSTRRAPRDIFASILTRTQTRQRYFLTAAGVRR